MNKLPISLSNASGIPYYRQIINQIAEMIQSGLLEADSLLPSVRSLAGDLLVSLITVRRAYSDLENAGLIIRRQGFGTYVQKNVETASKKRSQNEARAILESALVKARQLGLDSNEIRKIIDGHLARKE